jgi:hypothetical protein
MTRVDPIGNENLKCRQQSDDEVAQENGKMTGERSNDKDLRQVRPIRGREGRKCAERHLQNLLRDDREKPSVMFDGSDFQAQSRRLVGAGVQSRPRHRRFKATARMQAWHISSLR